MTDTRRLKSCSWEPGALEGEQEALASAPPWRSCRGQGHVWILGPPEPWGQACEPAVRGSGGVTGDCTGSRAEPPDARAGAAPGPGSSLKAGWQPPGRGQEPDVSSGAGPHICPTLARCCPGCPPSRPARRASPGPLPALQPSLAALSLFLFQNANVAPCGADPDASWGMRGTRSGDPEGL